MPRSPWLLKQRPPYIYRLIRSMGGDPEEVLSEATKRRLGYGRPSPAHDGKTVVPAERPAQPWLTSDEDAWTTDDDENAWTTEDDDQWSTSE